MISMHQERSRKLQIVMRGSERLKLSLAREKLNDFYDIQTLCSKHRKVGSALVSVGLNEH